ncbi:MAG: CoA transferase [Betaproteobacteria bacterium]|nr:CoA transferase [Betaproteobacteria bacterium]
MNPGARMHQALEGITVLDLSHALAGPFCTMTLGDHGARIVKIEPPGAGDIARAWGSRGPSGDAGYFVALHRNKRGIVLDLKNPRGKETFWRLLEHADVVVENYRVGALDKLGLGYAEASKRNPGIVYCSISGFGQDGPYRDRAALDLILQAESGMISVTGSADGTTARAGVSIADMTAGMNAAFGVMAALRVREKTGRGQSVDISMMEGQLALLGTMIGDYFMDKHVPRPMGTAYRSLLPYQTFHTATRDLALAVGSEKLWKDFCPAIGCPELADDPHYRTNQDRRANRATLLDRLQEVFMTKSYEQWEEILIGRGIPVGAINDLGQVVEHPQVKARGALVDVEHPRLGKVRVAGPAVRLSATPASVRSASPLLGQHTREVLTEMLAMTAREIDELYAAGALGAG